MIIWDNVNIGQHSQLNQCIVSDDTIIAENQDLKNNVITPSGTEALTV